MGYSLKKIIKQVHISENLSRVTLNESLSLIPRESFNHVTTKPLCDEWSLR